jgi:hypothetical protein
LKDDPLDPLLGSSLSSSLGKEDFFGEQIKQGFIRGILIVDLMSIIPISKPLVFNHNDLNPRKSRERQKCIKWKVEVVNLHLGDNMKLNEVMDLKDSTIVGHFLRKHMNG